MFGSAFPYSDHLQQLGAQGNFLAWTLGHCDQQVLVSMALPW